jgi:hypothetical protein
MPARSSSSPTLKKPQRAPKYHPENLIRMFRKAATFRNEMIAEGFSDNGGAIHSAERILNLLGLCIKYPGLSHGNKLRHYADAEFSIKALEAHKAGDMLRLNMFRRLERSRKQP